LNSWQSREESPPFTMRPRCLRETDFAAVEELFEMTFPKIPLEDLFVSWEFRSRENSIGIFCTEGTGAEGTEAKGTGAKGTGALIGFVIASYHRSSGQSLYIDYFALNPEYRGYGIGTNFLLQVVTHAFDSNGSIHLYPEREELVPWYERNGFRKTHGGYYVFHSYKTRAQTKVHEMLGLV
jgi:ribosomal protein S18 acetylase RimI-like enzyme